MKTTKGHVKRDWRPMTETCTTPVQALPYNARTKKTVAPDLVKYRMTKAIASFGSFSRAHAFWQAAARQDGVAFPSLSTVRRMFSRETVAAILRGEKAVAAPMVGDHRRTDVTLRRPQGYNPREKQVSLQKLAFNWSRPAATDRAVERPFYAGLRKPQATQPTVKAP